MWTSGFVTERSPDGDRAPQLQERGISDPFALFLAFEFFEEKAEPLQSALGIGTFRAKEHGGAAIKIRTEHVEDAGAGIGVAVLHDADGAFKSPDRANELRGRPGMQPQLI